MEVNNSKIFRRVTNLVAHLQPEINSELHHAELLQTQTTSAAVLREVILHKSSADYKENTTEITVDQYKALLGKEIGVSSWFTITQERVNEFADATGDHQWIHIDVERAKAESPFGGPVAHGFLTLSLFPMLVKEASPRLTGIKMGLNYGLNKIRFVSPVTVGSRVRTRVTLQEFTEIKGGGQSVIKAVLEREGEEKPSVVAEWVIRYYF